MLVPLHYSAPTTGIVHHCAGITAELPGNRPGFKSDVFSAGLVLALVLADAKPTDEWLKNKKGTQEGLSDRSPHMQLLI